MAYSIGELLATIGADTKPLELGLQRANERITQFSRQFANAGRLWLPTEQVIAKTGAAFEMAGTASRGAGAGINSLRAPLAMLAQQALGVNPALSRLSSILGTLALGSAQMVGVLAGLAAVSVAYQALTRDSRAAAEAQKNATEALKAWSEQRRIAGLGPFGQQAEQLAEARKLEQSLAARAQSQMIGGEFFPANPVDIRAHQKQVELVKRLEKEIWDARQRAAIEGDQEFVDLTRKIHEDRLKEAQRQNDEIIKEIRRSVDDVVMEWMRASVRIRDAAGRAQGGAIDMVSVRMGAPQRGYISPFAGGRLRGQNPFGLSGRDMEGAADMAARAASAAQQTQAVSQAFFQIAQSASPAARGLLEVLGGLQQLVSGAGPLALIAAGISAITALSDAGVLPKTRGQKEFAKFQSGIKDIEDAKAYAAYQANGRSTPIETSLRAQMDRLRALHDEAEELERVTEAERERRLELSAQNREAERQFYENAVQMEREKRSAEEALRIRILYARGLDEEAEALEQAADLRAGVEQFGEAFGDLIQQFQGAIAAAKAMAAAEAALAGQRMRDAARGNFAMGLHALTNPDDPWLAWKRDWDPILDDALKSGISTEEWMALNAQAEADLNNRKAVWFAKKNAPADAGIGMGSLFSEPNVTDTILRDVQGITTVQATRLTDVNVIALAELRVHTGLLTRVAYAVENGFGLSIGGVDYELNKLAKNRAANRQGNNNV